MRTVSTSSLPLDDGGLRRIALGRLQSHPANPNRMDDAMRARLRRNLERDGRYPPLIVRSHPEQIDDYQILDGHQRAAVLREMGATDALCYVWDCDDGTALRLLATLNRLRGEDVPVMRAELLAELTTLMPTAELSLLLPEDADQIDDLLSLLTRPAEDLLADLARASAQRGSSVRPVTFAVTPEDEAVIEAALAQATSQMTGPNRRGRALGEVARTYLQVHP